MLDLKSIVKILIVYIAVAQGIRTADFASRFVGTYLAFPPGAEHQTIVACNGGPLPHETAMMFEPLGASFLPRVNDPGFDVTAYQDVAALTDADMMMCFGESCYFHRPGWLARMVEAWERFGPGMYGSLSSFLVRAHLNTTAFTCAPIDLKNYPRPTCRGDRYDFEHGERALWRKLAQMGKPTKLVTWDGFWDPVHWRIPRNILWRGDQTNCLAWCKHNDTWREAKPEDREKWSNGADGPFR